MAKAQKIKGLIFVVVVGGSLLALYFQSRTVSKQLFKCSVYTVAHITHTYQLQGMSHIEYSFSVENKIFQGDEAVNNFDTGESWSVDFKKLSERRLLLKVYCNDPKVHRILWDIPVPDTLQYVPVNGWKEIPFEKQKSSD